MKYINLEKIKATLIKIQAKKEFIENHYLQALVVFNNILKAKPNDVDTVKHVTERKFKLDNSINHALLTLDELTRNLTLILQQISNPQFLAEQQQEGSLIEPVMYPDDIDSKYEYQKNLRNITDQDSLINNEIATEAKEFAAASEEFNIFLDQINKEFEFDAPKEIKQGLLNDQEYAFDNKIANLESSFKNQLDAIAIQNKFIEQQNQNLQEKMVKLSETGGLNLSSLYQKRSWDNSELYFAALDKSVNTAVKKFDEVTEKMSSAVNNLVLNQIENLEKVSLPLIKSLESSLNTIRSDFGDIKNENQTFKNQINDYENLILNLKAENVKKDHELKLSYDSWVANTKRINELEEILNIQTDDLKKVYEEKSDLIDRLESKISNTATFVNQIVAEKATLIEQNNDLFRQVNELQREISGEHEFDEYINTVSIQDLVEKEADKIVDAKIEGLLNKFKNEVELIKSESISYFMDVKENDERVLEKLINENHDPNKEINDQIKLLTKKINEFEQNYQAQIDLKNLTQDRINDLNLSLGSGPYAMVEKEKAYLTNKFDLLENKISESLERVKLLEDNQRENDYNYNQFPIDKSKLNNLFAQSELYEDFSQKLTGKEIEINALKDENARIFQENIAINSVLAQTMQKITINNSKMKELEELFIKQDYDFKILNEEKNQVIDFLINAIKNQDFDSLSFDNNFAKLNKYDFAHFLKGIGKKHYSVDLLEYVKNEVEKIIGNEIRDLKNKYENDLAEINAKYAYNPAILDVYSKTVIPKQSLISANTVSYQPTVTKVLKEYTKETKPIIPDIDQSIFEVDQDEQLNKDVLNYLSDFDEEKSVSTHEEEIVHPHIKELPTSEFVGDDDNLLDITVPLDVDPWNEIKPIDPSITKIVHTQTVVKNSKDKQLIEKMDLRNKNLENQIKNLQELINAKFEEELAKNKNIIEEKQTVEFIPNKDVITNIVPNFVIDHNFNNLIHNDLQQQQLNYEELIDKKIQASLAAFKNENQLLNKEYSSISVLDEPIWQQRDSLYLEKEIIANTKHLLRIQEELLDLENEIINEEKNLIVGL